MAFKNKVVKKYQPTQSETELTRNDGSVSDSASIMHEGGEFESQIEDKKQDGSDIPADVLDTEELGGVIDISHDSLEKAGHLKLLDHYTQEVLFDSQTENIDPFGGTSIEVDPEKHPRVRIEAEFQSEVGEIVDLLASARDYKIHFGSAVDNLLLDEHGGAVSAYSLRQLSKKYKGPAVRIRIADAYEYDVSFYQKELDWTFVSSKLTEHSASEARVVVFYDQIGGNDASQSVNASAPYLDTTKRSLRFEDGEYMQGTLPDFQNDISIFSVVRFEHASQPVANYDYVYALGENVAKKSISFSRTASNYTPANAYYSYSGPGSDVLIGEEIGSQQWAVFSQQFRTTSPQHLVYQNTEFMSVDLNSGPEVITGTLNIARQHNSTHNLNGDIRELIFFEQAKSYEDRLSIELDINSHWEVFTYTTPINLELKVLLEGPFNGTDLNTTLNSGGDLPHAHPYNKAPWGCFESLDTFRTIPNSDIVDWVLIELRRPSSELPDDAIELTSIAKIPAFLLKDGSIVALDGIQPVSIQETDPFFVIVHHRNHLPIMSSQMLTMVGGTFLWDFTTSASQAHLISGKENLKSLAGGVFGMYAGNPDGDRIISSGEDTEYILGGNVGLTGYLPGDCNMDGIIDAADATIFTNNENSESSVPLEGNYEDSVLDKTTDAIAAYGLRRLTKNYHGYALRIRLDDDTKHDIGFVENELDWETIKTLAGAGTAKVTRFYDQSRNSSYLEQTNSSIMPIIDPINQYIVFDDTEYMDAVVGALTNAATVFNVVYFGHLSQPTSNYEYVYQWGKDTGNDTIFSLSKTAINWTPPNSYYTHSGGTPHVGVEVPGQEWTLFTQEFSSSSPRHTAYINLVEDTLVTEPAAFPTLENTLRVGAYELGTHLFKGNWREFIAYDRTLSEDDRLTVEVDLDAYWDIFPFNPNVFSSTMWLDPNDAERLHIDNQVSPDSVRVIADKSTAYSEGSQVLLNADFDNWTNDDPDNWGINGTQTGTHYVNEFAASQAQFLGDGVTGLDLWQGGLNLTKFYLLELSVVSATGTVKIGAYDTHGNRISLTSSGDHKLYFRPEASDRFIIQQGGVCDYVFESATATEVEGAHVFQHTAANMPEIETVSGVSLLKSDTNTQLTKPNEASYENQEFSFFFVAKRDDPSDGLDGGFAWGTLFGSYPAWAWQIEFLDNKIRCGITNGTAPPNNVDYCTLTGLTDSLLHVYELKVSNAQMELFQDGVSVATTTRTIGTINYSSSFDFSLGNTTNGLNGLYGDTLYFPGVLSSPKSEYINLSLMEKHGVLWSQNMFNDYLSKNSHGTYSATAQEEFLRRLQPGEYLYDTFGPPGQNKKACDFVYLLEFTGDIATINNDKDVATDPLRWDFDGTIILNTDVSSHTKGGGAGICTVSSTDDWDTLTYLRLGNNTFSGPLPKFTIESLLTIDVYNNDFSGAIPVIDLPDLHTFRLYSNSFTTVPMLSLPALRTFSLAYMGSFAGPCPNFDFPNIEVFDLAWNAFSGPIPNFNFPKVETFWVYQNNFSGTCPNFSFPKVKNFSLRGNSFSGTIPAFSFPELTNFDINNNSFSGTIPNFSFPLVDQFYIQDNSFSGTMPEFNFPLLEYFRCGNNNFSGPLPNFNSTEMIYFRAVNNSFSSFPALNFPKVTYFTLEGNSLAGTCPYLDFPECVTFGIVGSNFTGNCPDFNLPKVQTFKFNDNGFTGPCPVFSFPEATQFWIQDNNFSGNIPNFNLPKVTDFRAHTNSFSGEMPEFYMPLVQTFRVEYNNFSGTCPNFNFPAVTHVELEGNQITGRFPNFNFPSLVTLRAENNLFDEYLDGPTWAGTVTTFNLYNNDLDPVSVDNILADFAADLTRSAATITLDGPGNAGPTSLGEADKSDLEGIGCTVNTNASGLL